jgi:hypothetical protein
LIFNELAQWAVLLFLCVLTVGLLRQLGQFIFGGDQGPGPRVGARLSKVILDGEKRNELQARIGSQTYPAGAALFLSEACPPCDELLTDLESHGDQPRLALAAIVTGPSSPAFRDRVAGLADIVQEDPDGRILSKTRIPRQPFLVWVDDHLLVRHNASGERLEGRVLEWLAPPGAEGPADSTTLNDIRRDTVEVRT